MSEPRITFCEHCQGEGRIYRTVYAWDGPYDDDRGPCNVCGETGKMEVETLPLDGDEDDLFCADTSGGSINMNNPEQPAAMSRQPIETAPKDGTEILIWAQRHDSPRGRWIICKWGNDYEDVFVRGWLYGLDWRLTLYSDSRPGRSVAKWWSPLPETPPALNALSAKIEQEHAE